jgi:hypothetical protein
MDGVGRIFEEQPISLCLMKNFCVMGLNPTCIAPKEMDCHCRFFDGAIGDDCRNRLFGSWCGSRAAASHARMFASFKMRPMEVGL